MHPQSPRYHDLLTLSLPQSGHPLLLAAQESTRNTLDE